MKIKRKSDNRQREKAFGTFRCFLNEEMLQNRPTNYGVVF